MHECGWPIHVCQNPENDGYFHLPEVKTQCFANAIVVQKQKDKNWDPEPGEILRPVYTRNHRTDPLPPMPPRREIVQ